MKKLFDKNIVLENERIIIKKLTNKDISLIKKMLSNNNIYKYTPTFIPEKQCEGDMDYFVNAMCDKLLKNKEELILGVYLKEPKEEFCGIAEVYHYIPEKKQVSVGARLDEKYWNKGIMSDVLALAINYLFNETDITTISGSNIVDNPASGRVMEKNGFIKIAENVKEDWGFGQDVIVNKWILKKDKE